MNKKGQVMQNLAGIGIGVVTFAIVMVVAFLIIGNTRTNMGTGACVYANGTYYSGAYNASLSNACVVASDGSVIGKSLALNSTDTLQSATATVPGWLPLIVLIAIGAVILGMVAMFRR